MWLLRGRKGSSSMPVMDYSREGSPEAILMERGSWGPPNTSKSFGTFSRTSSLADLAYVAIPGLTSRVARNRSVTSLANLSDAFSDFPGAESPVYIEGRLSRPLVQSVCVVLLSSLMHGYNCGNMNTSAVAIRATLSVPPVALTPESETVPLPTNDSIWAFVVCIFCLGAMVGCNSSAQLAERWGRKTFLLWNTVVFVVGSLLEAASVLPDCPLSGGWSPCQTRLGLLVGGRVLSGIAGGGVCVVVPTYLGEVAPAHLRGVLGMLSQLAVALGVLAGQVLGFPAYLGSVSSWPLVLALTLIPATLQLLLQPMLFESPRWYALLGNERMAEQQLVALRDRPQYDQELQEELFCLLRGSARSSTSVSRASSFGSFQSSSHNGGYQPPSDAAAAAAAVAAVGSGVLRHKSNGSSHGLYASSGLYSSNPLVLPPNPLASGTPCGLGSRTSSKADLLPAAPAAASLDRSIVRAVATQPAIRRAALVCLPLMAVQQLSGISNLFAFSSAVLRSNGLDDDATAQAVLTLGLANVASTLLVVPLMDRVGRRPLLLASLVLMGVGYGMLTLTLQSDGNDAPMRPLAACFAAAVTVIGYGTGLGPVVALLPAELLPAEHRASGAGVAWSVMWLAQCLTAAVHLEQARALGPQTFVPHIAVLALGFAFALAVMPETRGKSLEKIAQEMSATD